MTVSPNAPVRDQRLRARVGTDLVSVSDVSAAMATFGDRYLRRVYTPLEVRQAGGSAERIAARFAGKEAVVKVLRASPSTPLPYRDVEIASAPSGAPLVRLHGHARALARASGIGHVTVSLTHDHGLAFATAMTLVPTVPRKDSPQMKDTIRTVLDAHGHLSAPVATLADSDDLYTAGLTSHATVNVMLALEEELDVEFPDELLNRATFSSIDALDEAARSLAESE